MQGGTKVCWLLGITVFGEGESMPFHAQNSLIYSMFYRNLCNYFDIIPLFYFILFSCIIDLLFSSDCLTADLGRTAVIDKTTSEKGAYINQHLCLIRLNTHEVDPVFLSAFLDPRGNGKPERPGGSR